MIRLTTNGSAPQIQRLGKARLVHFPLSDASVRIHCYHAILVISGYMDLFGINIAITTTVFQPAEEKNRDVTHCKAISKNETGILLRNGNIAQRLTSQIRHVKES